MAKTPKTPPVKKVVKPAAQKVTRKGKVKAPKGKKGY